MLNYSNTIEVSKFNDFCDHFLHAPNEVYFYGSNGFGILMADKYIGKINLVGFIDTYKAGEVTLSSGKSLPLINLQTFIQNCKIGHTCIFITSTYRYKDEIRDSLISENFPEEFIFDVDVLSETTCISAKNNCNWWFEGYHLTVNDMRCCCYPALERVFSFEHLCTGKSLKEYFASFVAKRKYYFEQSKNGRIPIFCKDCGFLNQGAVSEIPKLNDVHYTAHCACNADCVYCAGNVWTNGKKHDFDGAEYMKTFIENLDFFLANNLLSPELVLTASGGEISVTPNKDLLYDWMISNLEYCSKILSNCFRYDSKASEILKKNNNNVLLADIDAGTPESFILVKGFNKFDKVVENLCKYKQNGEVVLKYIICVGLNDTEEDFYGTVDVLKRIGISKLLLSANYNDIRNNRDETLTRKIIFALAKFAVILDNANIEYEYQLGHLKNLAPRIEHYFRQIKSLYTQKSLDVPG